MYSGHHQGCCLQVVPVGTVNRPQPSIFVTLAPSKGLACHRESHSKTISEGVLETIGKKHFVPKQSMMRFRSESAVYFFYAVYFFLKKSGLFLLKKEKRNGRFLTFQFIKLSIFEKFFLLFPASFRVRIEILSFEKFKIFTQF